MTTEEQINMALEDPGRQVGEAWSHMGATLGAIVQIMIEKGICTEDELVNTTDRIRKIIDQNTDAVIEAKIERHRQAIAKICPDRDPDEVLRELGILPPE